VHGNAAREIEHAPLGQQTAAPDHVDEGEVDKDQPTHQEQQVGAEAQAIGPTVNSLQLPTNPDAPVSELSVNLADVNLLRYNFQAAGENRTTIVERFDAEIAPQPVE